MHENRIYALKIICGAEYPDQPPQMQFVSRINLPCVDQKTGKIDKLKLPCLSAWRRNFTLETVLAELRREMASPANKKLSQPSEGSTFQ